MARRKRKPPTAAVDRNVREKIQNLDNLLDTVHLSFVEYEKNLESKCDEVCGNITKMYGDLLKSIPEHIQKMTISEWYEHERKEGGNRVQTPSNDPVSSSIRSRFERTKQGTDKKTMKKVVKRSLSASANRSLMAPSTILSRFSRTMSDTSVFASATKASALTVTPKFDPRMPVTKIARKPKADEILLSLTGSPIQNFVNDKSVILSLGGGKVLTFNDQNAFENEFKDIDEPMLQKLKNVKETLDHILHR